MLNFDLPASRREFLEFMGRAAGAAASLTAAGQLVACSTNQASKKTLIDAPFEPISPSSLDSLILASGLASSLMIKWGDTINAKGEKFGFNSDYLAFTPMQPGVLDDGMLWVNHEYLSPLFIHGAMPSQKRRRKKEQIVAEQEALGGSLLRIRKDRASGAWNVVWNDSRNRRISGRTRIRLAWPEPIAGATHAIGTMGNCAGGQTPWRTVLTCEENYHQYYGERKWVGNRPGERDASDPFCLAWHHAFDYPPEHYGWVVEVDPFTGESKKLISLGRFAHECATTRVAKDGRCVVYSGDDANDQCIYKFVADRPGSLETGTLHVADTKHGRWLPLNLQNAKLRGKFSSQLELLIRTREAAALAGGTPLNRPEDIEIDPMTGAVFASLTNNKPKGDYFGSLLKIIEKDGDPLSLEFEASTFLAGGPEAGFVCPDNLAFDRKGNLWLTTDMSASELNRGRYAPFKNNGLFYIPFSGPNAGKAMQVASGPIECELTGPTFSPDGKTLFLSVQHPGEASRSLDQCTSNWPDGGRSVPRSAVVAITGPLLEKLLG